MSTPLVEVRNLVKHFPIRRGLLQRQVGAVHAVDDVSFDVLRGETIGLVGESGCGKSTTARLILRLLEPTAGTVTFDGRDISHLDAMSLKPLRREMQMIFQDPYSSLNPRKTVGSIIGEPFEIHRIERSEGARRQRVRDLMDMVGLNPEHYNRYPHEFSGGQRQRIGVARAIAVKPKLIVADEPVSALDVSIQAQIINLLADLKRELGLTLVFIAHDLSVVRHVCDRIAVMYVGKIAELAPSDELVQRPRHPYASALLSAVPIPDPALARNRRRQVLVGDVPSPTDPPSGCRFHPRCDRARRLYMEANPDVVAMLEALADAGVEGDDRAEHETLAASAGDYADLDRRAQEAVDVLDSEALASLAAGAGGGEGILDHERTPTEDLPAADAPPGSITDDDPRGDEAAADEAPELPPPPYVPVECSRDVPELEPIDGSPAHTCACWFPLPVAESAGVPIDDRPDGSPPA